jgi:hypothetical protein
MLGWGGQAYLCNGSGMIRYCSIRGPRGSYSTSHILALSLSRIEWAGRGNLPLADIQGKRNSEIPK